MLRISPLYIHVGLVLSPLSHSVPSRHWLLTLFVSRLIIFCDSELSCHPQIPCFGLTTRFHSTGHAPASFGSFSCCLRFSIQKIISAHIAPSGRPALPSVVYLFAHVPFRMVRSPSMFDMRVRSDIFYNKLSYELTRIAFPVCLT
jgi:hypothetical protein